MTYDYEDQTTYSVTVKADDGREGFATIPVTIDITDVNEVPMFLAGSDTRSIAENTPRARISAPPWRPRTPTPATP